MLIMDCDGTLTDGRYYLSERGELFNSFAIKDWYGIKHILPCLGIIPVIVSGRASKILTKRSKELSIKECYQGVQDKLSVTLQLEKKYNLQSSEIAYIGDDENDIECMARYYAGCPSDAHKSVKKVVKYISDLKGGEGSVRDFIEHLERISN